MNDIIAAYNPSVIVHMASFPRQKVVESCPAIASEVMATGLIHLLEAATRNKIQKFVYISSSMVYGDFETVVTEDAVCKPIGQYGIMKYMGEKLVEDYARRTGMEYVIIRPSAVYGELDVEDRVVSKFVLNAMRGKTLKVNGPDEVLDFTYVEDTAMGIALAATTEKANGNIYNITRSSTKICTLADAAELAIKIVGKGDIAMAPRDLSFPKRGRLSIDAAVRDLGYAPKVDIEEGFVRYHRWFQESEYWQRNL
jgi:nucleoside-diphosphate-sugar epimerase